MQGKALLQPHGDHKIPLIWWVLGTLSTYLLLFVLFYYCAGNIRPWIELFNGATWPDKWCDEYKGNRCLFSATIAFRTLVNASPLLFVIFLVRLAFLFKVEIVMDTLGLLSSLDKEVAWHLVADLKMNPDQAGRIKEIVAKATRIWAEKQLPNLIGKAEAKRFIEQNYSAAA